jgi:hypothetical protein
LTSDRQKNDNGWNNDKGGNTTATNCRNRRVKRTGSNGVNVYIHLLMKKLALIAMEGNGLSMVVGNPKKNEDFALLSGQRQNQIWILAMAFLLRRSQSENSDVRKICGSYQ